MNKTLRLSAIGIGSGTILALVLILIYFLTDNMAFYLLFNVDYIPVLKYLEPKIVVEITFHYIFCITSVVVLYYLLRIVRLEHRIMVYLIIYTGGSGILFFLTTFTTQGPSSTDLLAWVYWTGAHAIYSVIVGVAVKRWV